MTKYIELKGGLGNQLFQYFAGQFIAKECREDLVYILPDSRIHRIHKDSSVLDLELPTCVSISYEQANTRFPNKTRAVDWAGRKSEVARRILNQCTSTYMSGTVGYDPSLEKHLSSSHFKGYFQTFRYLSELQLSLGISITLRSPSLQFHKFFTDIEASKPIVIHIRGGDYKLLGNSMGLLGFDYYKNAISLARVDLPDAPIWVFSDDIRSVSGLMDALDIKVQRIILSDSGLTAAETMILISKCQNKIIANSTFSWWAAYIGNQTETVIAPNPWNRTDNLTEHLIPSHWKTVDSAWQI
jgi:hypothetical protein